MKPSFRNESLTAESEFELRRIEALRSLTMKQENILDNYLVYLHLADEKNRLSHAREVSRAVTSTTPSARGRPAYRQQKWLRHEFASRRFSQGMQETKLRSGRSLRKDGLLGTLFHFS